MASLPHGDQRKLEVALLMALDPHGFMFDEPAAGMNAAEAPVILDLIRRLKARQGGPMSSRRHSRAGGNPELPSAPSPGRRWA